MAPSAKAKILRKLSPNSSKNGAKTVENRAWQDHFRGSWRFWAFQGGSWGGPGGGPGPSKAPLGRPLGALWCRLGTQDGTKSALSSFQRIMVKRRPTKFGYGRHLASIFKRFCIDLGGQNGTKSVPQTCGNRRSDTVPKRLNFH